MKDIMGMMAKAKEMQSKMAEMQAEIEEAEATGEAGGGAVSITMRGNGTMSAVNIDPSLLKEDEGEILEDLIMAAHNMAKARMDDVRTERMKELTAGLPLPPGMKLPF